MLKNKILFLASLVVCLPSPTSAIDWSFLFFCFSPVTTVEVEGKGPTRMDALQIGDSVLTASGEFSKVYSFAHNSPDTVAEFVQIQAQGMIEPLEISSDHMIFVNQTVLPAKYVQAGDYLVAQDGKQVPVHTVDRVVRKGIYGPWTVSGDLMVNGVAASSYVFLDAVEPLLSPGVQHKVYHMAVGPYRLWCSAKGCEDETYNEAGMSKFAATMLPLVGLADWLVQNWVQVLVVVAGWCFVWKKRFAVGAEPKMKN